MFMEAGNLMFQMRFAQHPGKVAADITSAEIVMTTQNRNLSTSEQICYVLL